MFKSNTAFMIESTEKMIDAMGIDWKQATLPKQVKCLEVKCSFQGRERIPLIIRCDRILSWIGDLWSHILTLSHESFLYFSCVLEVCLGMSKSQI